jgi:hypothetical protein
LSSPALRGERRIALDDNPCPSAPCVGSPIFSYWSPAFVLLTPICPSTCLRGPSYVIPPRVTVATRDKRVLRPPLWRQQAAALGVGSDFPPGGSGQFERFGPSSAPPSRRMPSWAARSGGAGGLGCPAESGAGPASPRGRREAAAAPRGVLGARARFPLLLLVAAWLSQLRRLSSFLEAAAEPPGASEGSAAGAAAAAEEEQAPRSRRGRGRGGDGAAAARNLWDGSTTIPPWMKRYFAWHRSERRQLTRENWQTRRYLVLRCLREDSHCGRTATPARAPALPSHARQPDAEAAPHPLVPPRTPRGVPRPSRGGG